MATATISIEVDEEAARTLGKLPTEERRKIESLLALRLRELACGNVRPLLVVMDDIGARAEARELTPEILESILRDHNQ